MSIHSSIRTSTSDAAAKSAQQSFSISLAETLLHAEDQTHAKMDKTRSAFERMKKKAEEAQAAKDKEIAELKKALVLAEERTKAAEALAASRLEAFQEKEKSFEAQILSLKEKITALEAREKAIKEDIVNLAKTCGITPYIRGYHIYNHLKARGPGTCGYYTVALDLFLSKMSREYSFIDYR
jgi:DNA repair exonuclease SbcCD ATPase subunit